MSAANIKRTRIFGVFAVSLLLAYWHASSQVIPGDDPDLKRYSTARLALRELLDRSGDSFSTNEKRTLRDGVQQLTLAFSIWGIGKSDPSALKAVRFSCEPAMARILAVLDASNEAERFWLVAGRAPAEWTTQRHWPSGKGLVLLRVGRTGAETDSTPEFVSGNFDLATVRSPSLRLNDARTVYAALFFENAAPGTSVVPLEFTSSGRPVAKLNLTIEVPLAGRLKVTLLDGDNGKPTAAVAGLYASDHQLAVPGQALSFDQAGFSYRPGRVRPYQSSHYWPGTVDERQVFFADGAFSLAVPAGKYRLIVGKGFEYTPEVLSVEVQPGADTSRTVTLKRWINMPDRGWYSGDGHVHYERTGEESNRRLMTWAQAEDVHMINVVRMGDALKTYFEQYAFGKAGRKLSLNFALVPGQEDPRTTYIGHTLQMNLQRPVRNPDQYYLYDTVFDEVHRQGGLTGYAHSYQPSNMGFWVREDMTMNIPRQKVDFAEISEFGDINENLYYEFLNLGFKLTASAGSDVPWGHTIGTSRVYAYTGKRFDPDAWFSAVKAGRTFVTTGPILELTVNGQLPGAEITIKPGETLRIAASASGHSVPPRYLEVVSQGEVLKSSRQVSDGPKPLSVNLNLPIQHSTWIAARCAGAHTSPVYVRVGEESWWKLRAAPELIHTRLNQLHDIEELTKQGVGPGNEGGWNNPEGFQKQIPQLLERVEIARNIYQDMLRKAKLELDQKGQ